MADLIKPREIWRPKPNCSKAIGKISQYKTRLYFQFNIPCGKIRCQRKLLIENQQNADEPFDSDAAFFDACLFVSESFHSFSFSHFACLSVCFPQKKNVMKPLQHSIIVNQNGKTPSTVEETQTNNNKKPLAPKKHSFQIKWTETNLHDFLSLKIPMNSKCDIFS